MWKIIAVIDDCQVGVLERDGQRYVSSGYPLSLCKPSPEAFEITESRINARGYTRLEPPPQVKKFVDWRDVARKYFEQQKSKSAA